MFVGFVSMLLGLVLSGWPVRQRVRVNQGLRAGQGWDSSPGGGLLMAFGLMLCVGRMIEWTDAVGAL